MVRSWLRTWSDGNSFIVWCWLRETFNLVLEKQICRKWKTRQFGQYRQFVFSCPRPACAKILVRNGVDIFRYNSPADWVRELFKPSRWRKTCISIKKELEVLDLRFFYGWRRNRGRLFGPLHLAMDPIPRGKFLFFFSKLNLRKSASLESLPLWFESYSKKKTIINYQ